MTKLDTYRQRIQTLEQELDEMTVALSQAWDQLVPFLQEVPPQAETAGDIEPILQAVAAAADAELAAIYLLRSEEWFSVPGFVHLSPESMNRVSRISGTQTCDLQTANGETLRWAFVPIVSEDQRIGLLGIGTYDQKRKFTAVEFRIIVRMAERIASQVTAAQLAWFREKEAMQAREMQIANEIQQSVQPKNDPQNSRIKIASYWQPAKEVGGDAWGWVAQPDERLSWFILDVAGKGLPAALAAVALHTAISMALQMRLSTVDALRAVNRQFYEAYTRTDLMATAAILSLNGPTGALEIANAGHPPVLVRHAGEWLRLTATAPPIGVLPTLQPEPQVLILQPDDLVLSYSDGFTEIQTGSRLWGQTGLLKSIPWGAKDVALLTDYIAQASRRVGEINDDQTLVTVRYE
jgi:serine phosphatase RsbU (regulator of sigma subunit)